MQRRRGESSSALNPSSRLIRTGEVARMVHVEGLSLRAVAHHYHVGHSTIVQALERTGSIT